MEINKEYWPWSTSGLAMCSCGWRCYSGLLAHARARQKNFEVISCIPPGTPESHMERWARADSVPIHNMKAQDAIKYVKETKKILGLSISAADYSNQEIVECMKKFFAVNILAAKRDHKLNAELCKKITKHKFHWGLDDSHHGTEIFCSKRGLN
jgi:hypothetical protein